MKTTIPLKVSLLLLLAAMPTALFAQEDSSNTSYEASDATSVVYDQPVTYYSSVVYQSAVTYNAPVYYITAASAAAVDYSNQQQYQAQCAPREPASVVHVFGASGGSYTYANYGTPPCASSVVIQVGHRGGWGISSR